MENIKKNKKVFTLVTLIISLTAVMFFLYGFYHYEQKKEKPYKVIFIPKTIDSSNGFWTSLIAGAELGADEYGVDLEVIGGSSELDVNGQIENIRQCIKEKPDVMLVAPCSYSDTTDVLHEVVDAGIRLILIDSVINEDLAESIVATDNYVAGKRLGEYAKDYVTEEDDIAIIAHVRGSSTAIDRERGIRDGLEEFEQNVLDTVYCDSSYDRAYELTKTIIKNNPEVSLIMGTNEYSSVGAARAVKDLGLEGRIKVVGFDNSIEEIQLLEEGVFQAIIIQKPFNMGYIGIEQAVNMLTGKKVEKMLDAGCKLIDKGNIYEEENQRLLYPFMGQQ